MHLDRRSVIRRIYTYQFLCDFLPIAALYTVMFSDEKLTTTQIGVLVASWSLASLLAEVPSGVLADRVDRRKVLCAGQLLTSAGFCIWLTTDHFWGYAFGFVLWGISGAFHSGTFEALVYDELAGRDDAESYVHVLGRSEAVSLLAVVGSAAFAAPLVKNGYTLVITISAGMSLLAAAAALRLPRATPRQEVADERYIAMLRRGIRDLPMTPGLLRFVVLVCTTGFAIDLVTEYAPLFMVDAGFAAGGVALLFAGFVLAMTAGSALAGRIPQRDHIVSLMFVGVGTLILLGTQLSSFASVLAYGLSAVIAQVAFIHAQTLLQHRIEGNLRATTTSVAGFGQEVCNVILLVGFGLTADATTRSTAFVLMGIGITALGFVLVLSGSRRRHGPRADSV